jgi:hypothetical protein
VNRLECAQREAIRDKEAKMAPLKTAALLETELNQLNALKQLEFLRSTQYAQAQIEAESTAKV